MPFRGTLVLPSPEDPACPSTSAPYSHPSLPLQPHLQCNKKEKKGAKHTSMLLISIQLRLNKVSQIRLIIRRQALHSTDILPITTPHPTTPRKSAIVSRALEPAIQPLGTIRLRARPLAHNRPLIRAPNPRADATSRLDMLGRALSDLAVIEDLVLVRIEDDVVDAGLGVHEAVPKRLHVLEGVVDGDGGVGVGVAHGAPAVVVEFLEGAEVDDGAEGFVEQFDGRDDVGFFGVALGEGPDRIEGLLGCAALLPLDGAETAAVVEAVLGAGGWMGGWLDCVLCG